MCIRDSPTPVQKSQHQGFQLLSSLFQQFNMYPILTRSLSALHFPYCFLKFLLRYSLLLHSLFVSLLLLSLPFLFRLHLHIQQLIKVFYPPFVFFSSGFTNVSPFLSLILHTLLFAPLYVLANLKIFFLFSFISSISSFASFSATYSFALLFTPSASFLASTY